MPNVELLLHGMSVNTSQARLGLCTVVLLRGRRNVLVDVGHYGRRQNLELALQERGLGPADIHLVVLTHAHWDHAQTIDIFPNAEIAIHPAELDYTRSPRAGDWATPAYFAHTLRGLKVREVHEGLEVEDGVHILDTPGHTKGHISVVVDTPDGPVCIGGDAFTSADTVRTGRPRLIFWDEEQAEASVRKVLDTSRTIYPGHDRPFRIVGEGKTEYLVANPGIQVGGALEAGGSPVTVSLTLGPEVAAWSHPEAVRRR